MAAISQKVSPEEIAPLLARNIFLLGYEGSLNQARETEYLILLNRYVQQARELVALAGPTGVIRVTNCEDAKPLLQVLGYRSRPDCGQKGTYVETVDPQKAFLTIDSGFPLARTGKGPTRGQTLCLFGPHVARPVAVHGGGLDCGVQKSKTR